MNKRGLFMAIHQCEDQYVEEVVIEMENQDRRGKRRGEISMMRVAATAACCILLVGTGVTALAAVSKPFQNWLKESFTDYKVTKISVPEEEEGKLSGQEADIEANDAHLLQLKENIRIYRGDRESFICEVGPEDEYEDINKVYKVMGNGLKQLEISRFQGNYDGVPFDFEYAVIAGEILGFHKSGSISQVYPVMDGEEAYVELAQVEGDTVVKGCIAKLNLKTGAMEKITGDNLICNTIMVPGGKRILCNYRSEGYWTVLDLAAKTETRLKGISGYVHLDEISFIDETSIFTMTDEEYQETGEDGEKYSMPVCCLTDLQTGKVLQKIKKPVGDITPEWNYRKKDGSIEVYNLVTGKSFVAEDIAADEFHGVSAVGNYVLLWKSDQKTDETFLAYIWNMNSGKGMNIEVPEVIRGEVEIYLAASEQKILVSDGEEAYFVDISKL